jgi:hypothetical protein
MDADLGVADLLGMLCIGYGVFITVLCIKIFSSHPVKCRWVYLIISGSALYSSVVLFLAILNTWTFDGRVDPILGRIMILLLMTSLTMVMVLLRKDSRGSC